MVAAKEIVHPVFLECCTYTKNDPFWEKVFENLAYGKPPKGAFFSKGYICCAYKGREFSYPVERADPKVMYEELYALLKDKLGLRSKKQRGRDKARFRDLENTICEARTEWSGIRKKNVKTLLIERYVIGLRQKHGLSLEQANYLLAFISLAMAFKIITNDHIAYEDGKIKEIRGIVVESDNKSGKSAEIHLEYGISSVKRVAMPKKSSGKKLLSDHWKKFIKLVKGKRGFGGIPTG